MPVAKPKRTPRLMTVIAAGHLTPNMIRVTLQADFVRELARGSEGANCKLFLPEKGQDMSSFEAQLSDGPRPVVRTYTVRHIRPEQAEIDIDFVDHGDHGPASAWARSARPGSFLGFNGPSAVKISAFHADFFVVAADMSAIPVAAATLEAMPRTAKGVAFFEITSPQDRQDINAPPGIDIHWLDHPHPHVASRQVVDLIEALPPFSGSVQTCIAGESSVIQAVRGYLINTRGLPKDDAYISGYWKIGLIEDEHQKMKREAAA